jgi:EmrB/QacA subfamily drug resistance transporter
MILSAILNAALTPAVRKQLVLVSAILGSTIVFVDGTVVNVALPAIQDDLGGGLALQQWVVDAYLLTLGSLILIGGSLGDLFGARRIFALGTAGFGVTSILCAAAPTGNALIVARGLQGVAGALLTPAALAAITTAFHDREERGAAIGTWTAWTGVATVLGPLLGGWLVTAASWRAIFLINVPIAVITLALLFVALPKQPPRERRVHLDLVGAALCVGGLGLPVFALIEQPRRGWDDPLIVGSLVAGVLLFAAFVLWEWRAPHPMLPLALFKRRNFSVANLETLAVYGALSTYGFFLVLYLQQLAGYSALESGLALLPLTIVMFAFSRSVGRLSMRFGPRLFMGVGPLVCAAGTLALIPLDGDVSYWTDLLPGVLLFAVGLTLIVAPLTSTVLADAGATDAGIASGVNNAVARVAGLLAIAVVGAAVAGEANKLDLHGFRLALGFTAGLLVAGGVVGLVGIRNPSSRSRLRRQGDRALPARPSGLTARARPGRRGGP